MIPFILVVVAALLVGAIPLQLHIDTRRTWTAEMETWHSPGLEALPAPRINLAFPEPLTPMDLPPRDAVVVYTGPSRLRAVAGRHRLGVAAGTDAQQVRWNSPTGQFWAIVEQLGDLAEPCSHCSAPEDGEPAHVGCPGCSCPCSLAEVAR